MGAVDVVVVLAAAGLIAALGWFFFGRYRAGTARLEGGVQRVEVTVRGDYDPGLIKVRQRATCPGPAGVLRLRLRHEDRVTR